MRRQEFQMLDATVATAYIAARRGRRLGSLHLAWSNWGFGPEPLARSAERLRSNGIDFIELHGNRYGPDLGYRTEAVRRILDDHGLTVSGICGMATASSEFASNRHHVRQRAIDYFRRQADFCLELGGAYVLIVPGAVGRNVPYDNSEFGRAVEAIRIVADYFESIGVDAAVEPIRSEEVSLCHTFADATRLIEEVGSPRIRYINGDLFHMLAGESHVGSTILSSGDRLRNLHLADSNRRALGLGQLDLDVVLMALFAIGYDQRGGYCTAEPLGPGADPYRALWNLQDPEVLDLLVSRTALTFRNRQDALLSADDDDVRSRYVE